MVTATPPATPRPRGDTLPARGDMACVTCRRLGTDSAVLSPTAGCPLEGVQERKDMSTPALSEQRLKDTMIY